MNKSMDKIQQERDGSYRWSCRIDKDYHKAYALSGLRAFLIGFGILFLIMEAITLRAGNGGWIPAAVVGSVLVISVPLFYLYANASQPAEEYWMTEELVKIGYGRGAVFLEFAETEMASFHPGYIELTDKHRKVRVYFPAEDGAWIREYVMQRLPEKTRVVDYGTP